jgi:hypothetical protein
MWYSVCRSQSWKEVISVKASFTYLDVDRRLLTRAAVSGVNVSGVRAHRVSARPLVGWVFIRKYRHHGGRFARLTAKRNGAEGPRKVFRVRLDRPLRRFRLRRALKRAIDWAAQGTSTKK